MPVSRISLGIRVRLTYRVMVILSNLQHAQGFSLQQSPAVNLYDVYILDMWLITMLVIYWPSHFGVNAGDTKTL